MAVSRKTEQIILILSVAVIFITLILCIIFSVTGKNKIPDTVSSVSESQDVSYTIGVWEGKLAVFPKDGNTPLKVYDFYVSYLPENDRKLLESGITVSGKEELRQYLEDYTS